MQEDKKKKEREDRDTRTELRPKTPGELLPRAIFVPQEDPRSYARETVDSIFSDRFMALLALLLVPIILLEFLVALTPREYEFLEICDWAIVFLFMVEYLTKLYLAKSRWAHFRSPWHIMDLVIVIVPFVQFLPFLGLRSVGSASLLLRLLRLPRVFAAAGRAMYGRHHAVELLAEPEIVVSETVVRKGVMN